jgi:undecaprenyl-diphosphatase
MTILLYWRKWMTVVQAVFLGIIQGLTEFLPISSTAHLAAVPWIFGWQMPSTEALEFDVMLHLGTLCAVIIYFRKDLYSIGIALLRQIFRQSHDKNKSQLGWFLIAATIPGAVGGVILKNTVSQSLEKPLVIGIFLWLTAGILYLTDIYSTARKDLPQINLLDSQVIGFSQILALFPGVSRSGITISAGLVRGFDRVSSARFAFLLSAPIIFGAGLLEGWEILKNGIEFSDLAVMGLGFIVAAVTGVIVIPLFLRFVKKHGFRCFSIYCAGFGMLLIVIQILRNAH